MYKKLLSAVQNLIRQNPQRAIIVGAGALAILFMALWLSSSGTIRKYKSFSTREMEKRLDAEKSRDELQKENQRLTAKVQSLEESLAKESETLAKTQSDLTQQRLVNKAMQEETDKLVKAKRELEEQLKLAVLQGKISGTTKTKK